MEDLEEAIDLISEIIPEKESQDLMREHLGAVEEYINFLKEQINQHCVVIDNMEDLLVENGLEDYL